MTNVFIVLHDNVDIEEFIKKYSSYITSPSIYHNMNMLSGTIREVDWGYLESMPEVDVIEKISQKTINN